VQQQNLIIALAKYVLGMNHVIMANHMISLITSSTTDPSWWIWQL